jgi:peptidoglycan/LPS O-acetylase OafA/YrhL
MAATYQREKRILSLDGIRGLAAVCVLFTHLLPRQSFVWRAFPFGRFGVGLFFLLSGYLIIDLLLAARARIDLGAPIRDAWFTFYARRALRIFPLYYGVVLVLCLFRYAPVLDVAWWHLTYTSNIGYSVFHIQYANLSHFWSLCVEEQFYLVIPLITLLLPIKRSFYCIATIVLACLALKFTIAFTSGDGQLLARMPFSNIEGIAYGALIAYSSRLGIADRILSFVSRRLWLPGFAGAMLVSWVFFSQVSLRAYASNFSMTAYMAFPDLMFALSVGPLVALSSRRNLPSFANSFLSSKVMVYLGTISYGTYVYHFAMMPVWPRVTTALGIDQSGYVAFMVEIAITILIASASWFIVEKPVLRLKKRLPGRAVAGDALPATADLSALT